MREFSDNEEFLTALRDLIDRLEKQGNVAAAHELRLGYSCLNGLTDGCALLMQSMQRTIKADRGVIGAADMSELRNMLRTVEKVVYRR